MLGFFVPPTANVIQRRDFGLKSHLKDWKSPGLNSRLLIFKASSVTITPRRLLFHGDNQNLLHLSPAPTPPFPVGRGWGAVLQREEVID